MSEFDKKDGTKPAWKDTRRGVEIYDCAIHPTGLSNVATQSSRRLKGLLTTVTLDLWWRTIRTAQLPE